MKNKMVRQTQFKTGEVDVQNFKRTDIEEYLTAAQSLLNCEVGTTGLAKKRKGTFKVANATSYCIPESKIYEFVDQFLNYYILISNQEFFTILDTDGNFIQTVVTPYSAADLLAIDYAQDNDSIILANQNYPPARIYVSSYDPIVFSYEALNIYPYPAYDFNDIDYNSFTVNLSVTGTTLTFQFTGVGANPGFNSSWVGGQIIGGGANDTDPVGYAIITAVSYSGSGGGTVTFTGLIQIPFLTVGYSTVGSQYSVRKPAWSFDLGYPAKVLYFQNRLWFANTRTLNNTIFGSHINGPINFDVGIGADTDAIIYSIGVTNSGQINWLNGGKQIEIYSENFEFACPQDQNSALTPATFVIRQQSSYGSSSSLKPVTYLNDSYYITKTGNAIINFHFDGVGLAYTSANVSVAGSHLAKNPSNRALLRGSDQSQDNFVYFLNEIDNTITAFQFAQEYKLAALTPIVFQSDVTLIDIAAINNKIFILKLYDLTGEFILEVMDDNIKIDSARDAIMSEDGIVTGLDELNGYTVQVVYEKQDYGQYLVSEGEIIVDNEGLPESSITVGLLYNVEIKPMYLYAGTENSPFQKNISRIYIDYYNSINFYINGKLVPYQKFSDIQAGLPLQPRTDTAIVASVDGWDRFSTITITQSAPFDLQILAIAYQISVSYL